MGSGYERDTVKKVFHVNFCPAYLQKLTVSRNSEGIGIDFMICLKVKTDFKEGEKMKSEP